MLKYINRNEYAELLGMNSIPNNFDKLVIEASMYINHKTSNRIDNVSEKIKYATCLLVNLLNKAESDKEESRNLKSQNIEGWSETYRTPEEIESKLEEDMYNVLKQYLYMEIGIDGKPLLYCGVC